jgi:hypothetical protein
LIVPRGGVCPPLNSSAAFSAGLPALIAHESRQP